jgi:site-specific recombinase XerD
MFAEKTAAGLDGFVDYLCKERGVSPATVAAYVSDVARFLARRSGGSDLCAFTAAEVSKAVLGEAAGRSPASVRRYGCAVRSFLRYCQLAGLIETDLSAAVLPVSGPATVAAAAGDQRGAGQGGRCCAPVIVVGRSGGGTTR